MVVRVDPASGVLSNRSRPRLEADVDRLDVQVVVGEAVPKDVGGADLVDETGVDAGLVDEIR